MREILFRGKTVFNGTIGSVKWVESENFRCDNGRWYIGGYRVADETVCQFTGLTDKNGVKIFEGDITNCNKNLKHEVVFINGGFRYKQIGFRYNYTPRCLDPDDILLYEMEVIGNIHDGGVR